MEICGYNIYQAEQCALIVDNVGEVVLRTGTKRSIEKMSHLLSNNGLNVRIDLEP